MYRKKDICILIVEDEYSNAQYLKAVLLKLEYKKVFLASKANEAIELVKNNKIDIAFMDINLEGSIDGIFCAHMINEKKNIPIIFTTAYEESDTINDAMDTNIYGYIIKPYRYKDVEITLKIALKRAYLSEEKTNIEKEDFLLNSGHFYIKTTKTLLLDSIPIKLTKKETLILDILIKNLNQIVTYDALKKYVWEDKDIASSTIRDTILRLRKKAKGLKIENIPAMGYCLKN